MLLKNALSFFCQSVLQTSEILALMPNKNCSWTKSWPRRHGMYANFSKQLFCLQLQNHTIPKLVRSAPYSQKRLYYRARKWPLYFTLFPQNESNLPNVPYRKFFDYCHAISNDSGTHFRALEPVQSKISKLVSVGIL